MSKIGLTVLREDAASPLSPHFGVAKWIMVCDTETDDAQLIRNEGLSGRAVVDVLVQHGCTDAIFSAIGDAALDHLRDAGIRGWFGPTEEGRRRVVDRWRESDLEEATTASHVGTKRQRRERQRGS